MTRHRTDLLSLLSGLAFIALAVAARNGVLRVTGPLDLRWVWPALLIGGGLTLLAGITRDDAAGDVPAGDTTPGGGGGPDAAGWESPPVDG